MKNYKKMAFVLCLTFGFSSTALAEVMTNIGNTESNKKTDTKTETKTTQTNSGGRQNTVDIGVLGSDRDGRGSIDVGLSVNGNGPSYNIFEATINGYTPNNPTSFDATGKLQLTAPLTDDSKGKGSFNVTAFGDTKLSTTTLNQADLGGGVGFSTGDLLSNPSKASIFTSGNLVYYNNFNNISGVGVQGVVDAKFLNSIGVLGDVLAVGNRNSSDVSGELKASLKTSYDLTPSLNVFAKIDSDTLYKRDGTTQNNFDVLGGINYRIGGGDSDVK